MYNNETILLEDKPETFIFSKPRKYKNAEIMACKIKNKNNEQILIQFPKMTLVSDYHQKDKSIELEFKNEIGYTKKIYNFLSTLDEYLLEHISLHSEQWFGKTIPIENIKNMYTKFIKAPKTSENKCTLNFIFGKAELIDKKNEETFISELVKGVTVECISQLKYLVFTKDTCFLNWEIRTAKIHKKITRVPKFGFIEEPCDNSDDDSSDEENITFF